LREGYCLNNEAGTNTEKAEVAGPRLIRKEVEGLVSREKVEKSLERDGTDGFGLAPIIKGLRRCRKGRGEKTEGSGQAVSSQ